MQVYLFGSTQLVHGLPLQFDEAMNKALEKEVTTKTTFKGHLDSYRFCDQVLPVLVLPILALQLKHVTGHGEQRCRVLSAVSVVVRTRQA